MPRKPKKSTPAPELVAEPTPPQRPEVVTYSAEPPSALITITRPEVRNAIDDAVINALHTALDRALDDEKIRAVIITGADGAFCSGLDLQDFARRPNPSHEESVAESAALARLFRRLRSFEKVTIAAVNGPALGSGCGLAALCDFTLAGPGAELGFTELRLGFVPAITSVYLSWMLPEKRLRDLVLSGRVVSAEEAARVGLATEVVPDAKLLARCREIAAEVAKNAPMAVRTAKELLEMIPGLDVDRAVSAAVEVTARARESDESREGVASFLEKRPPRWATGGGATSGAGGPAGPA